MASFIIIKSSCLCKEGKFSEEKLKIVYAISILKFLIQQNVVSTYIVVLVDIGRETNNRDKHLNFE